MGSYNAKGSQDLQDLLEEMPLKDGDAWIAALMRKNELLGRLNTLSSKLVWNNGDCRYWLKM